MKTGSEKNEIHGQNLTKFKMLDFAMNKVHEAAYLVDENSNFHYVNENAYRILGYTRDELLHLTVSDIDPDYPITRWADHWIDLKKNGSIMFEARHKTRDGRIFPVEINANYFEYGGRGYNLALVRDISERKRNEEALRDNEQKLRSIFMAMEEALSYNELVLDEQGEIIDYRILEVNAAYEKDTGLTREETIGKTATDLYGMSSESINAFWKEHLHDTHAIKSELYVEQTKGWKHISTSIPVKGRFVVSHFDISEQKKAEETLFEGQQMFRTLVENSPDIIARYDLDCQRIYVNPTYLKVAGIPQSKLLATSPVQLSPLPAESARILQDMIKRVLKNGTAETVDVIWPKADNIDCWYNIYASPEFDREGKVVSVMTTSRDITQRKQAEKQILKLNRIYAVLSNINQVIVRVRDPEQILNEACRITIEYGMFKMAWIGMVNLQTNKVDVVASNGFKGDYLDKINIDLSDERRCSGPTGIAVKTGKCKISNNVLTDDSMAPWRDDIIKYGYKSVASFPLIVSDKIIGAITVYDSDLNFFQEQDINLLDEMAQDISFALEFLESETKRKQASLQQIESEQKFRSLAESSPDNIIRYDLNYRAVYVNHILEETLNSTASLLIGKTPVETGPKNSIGMAQYQSILQHVIQSGQSGEVEIMVPNLAGELRTHHVLFVAERNNHGNIIGAIAIGRDINERKQVEEALRESEERYRLITYNTSDTITICDLNLNPVFVSPSVFKLQGYTVEEAMTKTVEQTFTPESIEKIKKELAEQIELEKSGKIDESRTVLLELEMYRKDLSLIWVELAASFFRNKEYKPIGIMTIARNITQRKQAEEEHNSHLLFVENMDKVNRAIQGAYDIDSMMNDVLHEVLSIFDCDRTWLFYPCDPDAPSFRVPMEITKPEYPGAKILNVDLPMPPDMARNLREVLESAEPVIYAAGTEKPINKVSAEQFGVMSMMMVALYPKTGKPWAFGMHQCSFPRIWTREEKRLFQEIGRRLTDSLTSLLILRNLKESEERYRLIAENTADTIIVFDLSMHPKYVSPSILKLRGFSVQETMSQSLDQILTPESLQKAYTILEGQIVLEKKKNIDLSRNVLLELEVYCKNGSIIWVELAASFIRDKNQSPSGILTVTRNITDRKRADEKLRVFSRAVEQSPASIIITNVQGDIEYTNSKFTTLTGYTLDEVHQQNPRILKSGELSPDHYKELWQTITSGKEWYGEFHNRKKNGELYWEMASISPVFDANGTITHFLSVKEDITDRKHAEEEILKLNQELENRVASRTAELEITNKELESFTYSVSHDLRAPLRGIDGFSQILLEEYQSKIDDQGITYLQKVRSAAQHMSQLIEDLLNLSQVGRGKLNIQQVNLSKMFREIGNDLQETQPERKVELIISEGIHVFGDSNLLHIVLENLLGNAWKFTSKHLASRIEFGMQIQKERIVYFVRDDGAGFDMTYANKLFDAFQRLHTNSEFLGTGIGLATVQRIIQRHGGIVWAEGFIEKGATFYFTIP